MEHTYLVKHNQRQSRFEVVIDAQTAVLEYYVNDGVITFTHTGVPPELEGRGIGSQLVKAGLNYARENKFRVRSFCWFVDKYMKLHPDWEQGG